MSDEKEKEELKNLYLNYQINKDYYPDDIRELIEQFFSLSDFYHNVYEALIENCSSKLTHLAYTQYPDLSTITSPILLEYIKTTNEAVLSGIVFSMKKLVMDMLAKRNISEQFPKLQEWREFYMHPTPHTMKETDRNRRIHPDDLEWKKYVEKENREMKRFFIWEEKRKTEFYNIVQPELMKLYPAITDLEGDFWVLYAVIIRDEYEIWKSIMEKIEGIIIYEMPPESIEWDHKKFGDEHYRRYSKYGEISMKKRNDQINSIRLDDEL